MRFRDRSHQSMTPIDRREFLRQGIAVGAATSFLPVVARAEPEAPRVRRYASLGKTGMEISDISFGGSRRGFDERLVREAFDLGIHYFDTAEGCRGGDSEKIIGVVAMKTLMGGKLNDLKPYETSAGSFPQAAFRWVLSNPRVDALIVSMTRRPQADEYLGASGWQRSAWNDPRLLFRYAQHRTSRYRRHGCAGCSGVCPRGVEIPEVLRTRMYAEDYGDLELAQACSDACPYGIPIASNARATHRRLVRS
ncbi:MAG: hypothetical protein GY725_16100 [bacterium]|nr:hypothetical protein [bacterium]